MSESQIIICYPNLLLFLSSLLVNGAQESNNFPTLKFLYSSCSTVPHVSLITKGFLLFTITSHLLPVSVWFIIVCIIDRQLAWLPVGPDFSSPKCYFSHRSLIILNILLQGFQVSRLYCHLVECFLNFYFKLFFKTS